MLKDDAAHDPQWSDEQLVAAKLTIGGRVIDARDVTLMKHLMALVFEVLERAWAALGTLADSLIAHSSCSSITLIPYDIEHFIVL